MLKLSTHNCCATSSTRRNVSETRTIHGFEVPSAPLQAPCKRAAECWLPAAHSRGGSSQDMAAARGRHDKLQRTRSLSISYGWWPQAFCGAWQKTLHRAGTNPVVHQRTRRFPQRARRPLFPPVATQGTSAISYSVLAANSVATGCCCCCRFHAMVHCCCCPRSGQPATLVPR